MPFAPKGLSLLAILLAPTQPTRLMRNRTRRAPFASLSVCLSLSSPLPSLFLFCRGPLLAGSGPRDSGVHSANASFHLIFSFTPSGRLRLPTSPKPPEVSPTLRATHTHAYARTRTPLGDRKPGRYAPSAGGALSFPNSTMAVSSEVKLVSAAAGLYSSFLYWGYLQEKITGVDYVSPVDASVTGRWHFSFVLNGRWRLVE